LTEPFKVGIDLYEEESRRKAMASVPATLKLKTKAAVRKCSSPRLII
jgi:hypothetical protein